MPELAEVEFYRKQWDPGLGERVLRGAWHGEKRLFRGVAPELFAALTGATLVRSEARAQQMLFVFARPDQPALWLGVHLGMTGKLSVESPEFEPGKHDHLALFQKERALVFTDPRMFGRVQLAQGGEPPGWWSQLPPPVTSPAFTLEMMEAFLERRARLAVKGALLVQSAFPGVGNWMADEILWRAGISPKMLCGKLSKARRAALWREAREVCRVALETIAVDFSDPPADWFFHERWTANGRCPRCAAEVKTATIGGRTTRWCGRCQH